MIDPIKRKRVMQRSIKLGHCICNPAKGCPCDEFKEQDVCHCAGERSDQVADNVLLTRLVEYAGCASKINQNDLKTVLSGLPEVSDPRVLVGTNTCDDAGVFKLTEDTALVQTVDVFTPSVDDPYAFGQIAAANSLSDVYAMGGTPITALSIIGFPADTVDLRVMTRMLHGGLDKMRQAGTVIIGGHSINDKSPKFGFAVTGLINPSRIITNAGARPGDILVLTKPLGTGVISFAAQMGKASESAVKAATNSMCELNKSACEAMVQAGVESATDVTGFGLMGHLSEMACQSGVSVEIFADRVPMFDEVAEYIRQGMISGAVERNMEFSSQFVRLDADVSEDSVYVLYDPQTSGGMLMAVPPAKLNALLADLKEGGAGNSIIGRVIAASDNRIYVRKTGNVSYEENNVMSEDKTNSCCCSTDQSDCCCDSGEDESCCCSDEESSCCCAPVAEESNCCCAPATDASAKSTGNPNGKFMAFMGEVTGDGSISARNKELISIALSVLSKCEPCVKIHINKAHKMGITDAEIEEAAWMGIAFGGAPVMMFYNTVMGRV
ncbi:MAG: selenide, water dikinase SelD [Armatimonadota bacterium]